MFVSRRVSLNQANILLDSFLQDRLLAMMASETKDEDPKHINLKVMAKESDMVQSKIKRHLERRERHGSQGTYQGDFCLQA